MEAPGKHRKPERQSTPHFHAAMAKAYSGTDSIFLVLHKDRVWRFIFWAFSILGFLFYSILDTLKMHLPSRCLPPRSPGLNFFWVH
jgi:hypothetical protein